MKDFYYRYLPHWHPDGQTFFITFRLANSLPVSVIKQLEEERKRERQSIYLRFNGQEQQEELYRLDKKYFGHFDTWLDRCIENSPRWLIDDRIFHIISETIHDFDGERYSLIAYCIMPNHIHLLIDTNLYKFEPKHEGITKLYPLTDTLKRLKGRTARLANQILDRNGNFWHHESYDHVVRDNKEFERILWYVLNNPVKAGFVENWKDWRMTYIQENDEENFLK